MSMKERIAEYHAFEEVMKKSAANFARLEVLPDIEKSLVSIWFDAPDVLDKFSDKDGNVNFSKAVACPQYISFALIVNDDKVIYHENADDFIRDVETVIKEMQEALDEMKKNWEIAKQIKGEE